MAQIGRLLQVHNRHGQFTGDVDKVELVLKAFREVGDLGPVSDEMFLMQEYMNEAADGSYSDVTNCVELAIMVADITPHIDSVERYRILANRMVLR